MIVPPTIRVLSTQAAEREALAQVARRVSPAVASFENVQALAAGYDPMQPCCVMAHVHQPESFPFEIHHKLAEHGVKAPVVIFCEYDDIPKTVRAIEEGVFDVISLPSERAPIMKTLQLALQADEKRIERIRRRMSVEAKLETLTRREQQVLQLVMEGKSTSRIAWLLRRSEKTIKLHRAHLMKKLGVHHVVILARQLLANGVEFDLQDVHRG